MFDEIRQCIFLCAVYMPHVPLCERQTGSNRCDGSRPRLREHDQGQAQIKEAIAEVL